MLNSGPVKALDGAEVRIYVMGDVRTVFKEKLETYLFSQMKEMSDPYKFEIREDYKDAYEWLFLNIYRAHIIQLYSDGEIRIDIEPSEIVDNKRCIFLKECDVENRNFDSVLYDELEMICYFGLDVM